MTTPNATPATAPTAAPSTPSAAPSTSSTPSASKPVTPMSTSDFKSFLRTGKSTPKEDFSAPEVHDDSESADVDFAQESASDDFSQESVEEQVEQTDESAPADYSWAEPFAAYRDGIHGVATTELLQALADGQIPDALMDKLTLTMKDGDDEWTGTVGDLRNSAQMHSNFTRKSQALAAEKKQYEAERGELINYLRSWKEDESGEKGLIGLEKMLGEESVMKIARKLAERLERKEQLEAAEAAGTIPAGTAAIVLERERLARENEELRRVQTRDTEQKTQAQTSEQAKQTGQKIWAEGQRQFASLGIQGESLTPGLVKLFKEELATLWEDPNVSPNPQMIRTAALAAKQRSEAYVREIQAEERAKAAKQAGGKPAVRGAAPAGAAAPAARSSTGPTGGRTKPMSTAEFRKMTGVR